MTTRQVSDEISRINRELPQKINDNTILESVSYDQAKSTMVSHYTVESWDGANLLAWKQSKHLFCEVLDQQYRGTLFSMAAASCRKSLTTIISGILLIYSTSKCIFKSTIKRTFRQRCFRI